MDPVIPIRYTVLSFINNNPFVKHNLIFFDFTFVHNPSGLFLSTDFALIYNF